MRDRRVQRIQLVLHEELPVRMLHHPVTHRHDLDLAFGRPVAHVVEGDSSVAQEFFQTRARRRRDWRTRSRGRLSTRGARLMEQSGFAEFMPRPFVALRQRDALDPAVEMKTPGVIGTHETRSRVARRGAAQLHPAVRAAIVKHVDAAGPVTDHDHRLTSYLKSVEIAGCLDLRLVSAIHPDFLEDFLDLVIEYFLIRINGAVNAIRLNQLSDRPHSLSPLSNSDGFQQNACSRIRSSAAIQILPRPDDLRTYILPVSKAARPRALTIHEGFAEGMASEPNKMPNATLLSNLTG